MITLLLGGENCFSHLKIIHYIIIHFKRAKKENNRYGFQPTLLLTFVCAV